MSPASATTPRAMPRGQGFGGTAPPKGSSRQEVEVAVLPAEHGLWGGAASGVDSLGLGRLSGVVKQRRPGKDHVTKLQGPLLPAMVPGL